MTVGRAPALLSLALVAACSGPLARVERAGEVIVELDYLAVASTEAERRDGLRPYTPLENDSGLLLVFPGPSEVCIANDGVSYAIDVVFSEAESVTAVELAVPPDDATPRCHRADMVLEVQAGVAERVQIGDDFIVEL